MKKFVAILLLAMFAVIPAMGQQNNNARPHFDPNEFRNRMDGYIRFKAGLTQEEGDKLFPIYHELKNKQMEYYQKIQKLKRAPQANTSSKECADNISKITSLGVEQAKMEQNYYAKMCKVVDAKKVYNVMLAEDEFHREALRGAGAASMMHNNMGGNFRGNGNRNWWGGGDQRRNGDPRRPGDARQGGDQRRQGEGRQSDGRQD